MNERISYWLIPVEPEKSFFSKIITDLAERFAAPKFEPHVTLYSGPAIDVTRADKILASAAAGISEIVLRTSGFGHSEKFTKTLFVNYELDEAAAKLSNELKKLSLQPNDYRFEPHLSLIYAHLPTNLKESLARETRVPPFTRFDAIQAVITGAATETKRDVERWRVAAHKSFSAKRL